MNKLIWTSAAVFAAATASAMAAETADINLQANVAAYCLIGSASSSGTLTVPTNATGGLGSTALSRTYTVECNGAGTTIKLSGTGLAHANALSIPTTFSKYIGYKAKATGAGVIEQNITVPAANSSSAATTGNDSAAFASGALTVDIDTYTKDFGALAAGLYSGGVVTLTLTPGT